MDTDSIETDKPVDGVVNGIDKQYEGQKLMARDRCRVVPRV